MVQGMLIVNILTGKVLLHTFYIVFLNFPYLIATVSCIWDGTTNVFCELFFLLTEGTVCV